MVINTSMSPWLRAQSTYKRLGLIIRNELYNAYGGVSQACNNQFILNFPRFVMVKSI